MEELGRSGVICCGGLTIDTIFHVDRLPKTYFEGEIQKYGIFFGGRAPNVAYSLSRLGVSSGIISPVGDDFESSGYMTHLDDANVDLRGVVQVPQETTTRIFLFSDPTGRHITFFHLGASRLFSKMAIPKTLLSEYDILHVSSSGDRRFNLETARAGKMVGCYISFDPGNDPAIEDSDYVASMIAVSRWLFLNTEELEWILRGTGKKDAKDLLDHDLESVIIIHKRKGGATVYSTQGTMKTRIPGFSPADLTGASDGLIAGYLTGLLRGMTAKASVMLGLSVLSCVSREWGSQKGAPDWDQAVLRASELFGSDWASEHPVLPR